MSKHTTRDSVWNHALRLALSGESFGIQRIRGLISKTMSDRTIRDTLNTMTDQGWLSKDSLHSHEWNPGPRISDEETDSFTLSEQHIEPTPVSDMSSPSDLDEGEFYSGKVSKFHHDAAHIELENGHINLGPIDPSAEGKRVVFENVGWNWGRCISKEYINESYNPRNITTSSETTTSSDSTSSNSTSSNSSNESLSDIAEEAGTTTSSQASGSSTNHSSGWDDRKKDHLKDIGKTHK